MIIWYLSAYDQPFGQSQRTFEFSKYFTKSGYQVTFFTNAYCHFTKRNVRKIPLSRLWVTETINDVRIVWMKTYNYKGNGIGRLINGITNSFVYSIFLFRSRQKPNVIVAPSVPIIIGYFGLISAKVAKTNFIYEIRDLWPIVLVQMGYFTEHSLVFKLFRYMEKKIYKEADAIVSTIDNVNDHIVNCLGYKKEVTIIPNGIDISKYHSEIENANTNITSDYDNNIIMYVGGFSNDHDVENIVFAAEILWKQQKGFYQFHIYGNGPNKNKCINLAVQSGILGKNIFFYEPAPKESLIRLQRKAKILLVALKDTPAFQYGLNLNKVLHYFLSKRPVIISSNNEDNIIRRANAGLSIAASKPIELANALIQLMSLRQDELDLLGNNGFKYLLDNLEICKLGDRYINLLKSINKERI